MPTSIWTPDTDQLPPEIKTLIKKDQQDFYKHFKLLDEKTNLTLHEQRALRELTQNKHIIIKPADKGSTVVILGRDQYVMKAKRQLNDTKYYKQLRKPIYLNTVPKVHKMLAQLHEKKFINEKQLQYLKGDVEPRLRRFYILPKIHKDPKNWTVPFKVPAGRPIVADCGSETYQTAEYLDYFLNPLSVKHPSYIKDTYHFVNIIKTLTIPSNSFFFSIDIESLYTNIDISAGMRLIKNIFIKYPDENRPDGELLNLLEINLKRNDFEFNGEYFLQIKGTAMGKRFAPSYANIFMADWEEKALQKCKIKPLVYLRYLDDIFGICTNSKEEFLTFIKILDTHDSSIHLKYTFHERSIDFLDTTVYKGNSFEKNFDFQFTRLFKDTDTHSLLFKTSFHPQHTHKGLVKSQLLRFRRICTQDEDFRGAMKVLFSALRHRGYSRSFLRRCVKTLNDSEQKQNNVQEMIPLIKIFSTGSKKINHIIKNNFKQIITDQGLLRKHQVISAYRQNKNLRDYLVKAKVQPLQQSQTHTNLQDHFIRLQYIQNRVDKNIFKIPQTFTLKSKNCVCHFLCKMETSIYWRN
uniref:Reverse transcriptase domain-containing protein n=1 Tax=Oryzias sinensis TaxID=183150 RepID=A0A8C7YA98_9TELE